MLSETAKPSDQKACQVPPKTEPIEGLQSRSRQAAQAFEQSATAVAAQEAASLAKAAAQEAAARPDAAVAKAAARAYAAAQANAALASAVRNIRIREGRTWYSGLGYGAKTRGDLARASARPSTPGLLEIFAWH